MDRDEVSEPTAADDAPKCTTHRIAVAGGGALISCEVPYFTDSNNIIVQEAQTFLDFI